MQGQRVNWAIKKVLQKFVNHLVPGNPPDRAESWGYHRYLEVGLRIGRHIMHVTLIKNLNYRAFDVCGNPLFDAGLYGHSDSLIRGIGPRSTGDTSRNIVTPVPPFAKQG